MCFEEGYRFSPNGGGRCHPTTRGQSYQTALLQGARKYQLVVMDDFAYTMLGFFLSQTFVDNDS